MRTIYGYHVRQANGGFKRSIIIDAKGHLMGRLAAIVAKKLLQGQAIIVVRCEEINISGSLYRQKLKWAEFRRKRTNTNPKWGPFHLRHPSKFFWRVVRGMLPHKTKRGAHALSKLETYEGVPPKYNQRVRVVVPRCLTAIKLQPGRRFCRVGDLCASVGWHYNKDVERLEEKRMRRSSFYVKQKSRSKSLHKKAVQATKAQTKQYDNILKKFGML